MTPLLLSLSPFLILVVGGLAVMMADAFLPDKRGLPELTAAVLFMAGGASLALALGHHHHAPELFSRYFASDAVALTFDVLLCTLAGLTVLCAGDYLREHQQERPEFYPLFLFATFGAVALARASDLLSLFLGLETLSLGVYALVAFRRTSPRATEAAVKYYLLGSFASALLLLGAAYLYGATAATGYSAIHQAIADGRAEVRLLYLAVPFLLAGFAFKLGAVPFQWWTPDAYEGALTPVSAFMSSVVKIATVAATWRLFHDGLTDSAWVWPGAAIAAASMVVGSFGALGQTNIKRVLAYSSVSHTGTLLLGILVSTEVHKATGALVFYAGAYGLASALAFVALAGFGSKGREAVSFGDLAGAGLRHPWRGALLSLSLLSLMGMPPALGFFAKYVLYADAFGASAPLPQLAVLGILTSAVSAYYYLRVGVALYMNHPDSEATTALPMRAPVLFGASATLALLLLGVSLYPAWLLGLTATP